MGAQPSESALTRTGNAGALSTRGLRGGQLASAAAAALAAGGADVDDALHDVGKRGWIRDTGLVSVVNFRRGVNRRTLRLLP